MLYRPDIKSFFRLIDHIQTISLATSSTINRFYSCIVFVSQAIECYDDLNNYTNHKLSCWIIHIPASTAFSFHPGQTR